MDLKNSTNMFQAQHIKYRKDTLSRTKVFSWWIRCYFTPIVTAALSSSLDWNAFPSHWQMHYFPKLVFSTEGVPSLIHSLKGQTNELAHSLDYSICDPCGPWTNSPIHCALLTSRTACHQLSQRLSNLCSLPKINHGFNQLLTVEPVGMVHTIIQRKYHTALLSSNTRGY